MKNILFLLGALCTGTLLIGDNFLSHSKAVSAGRSGDHAQAQKLLQKAIISSPHDAGLLFDAGVAEFKCGKHKSAAHYFEKAALYASDDLLQQEGLFNAGNAFAHLKEYDNALQSYEKILAKNSAHERAKHNYELVKKLKEQEESQQDQQDNKQQDKNKKNDDKDQQDNKSDSSKDGQNEKSDSSDNKSSDGDNSSDDEGNENSGDKDSSDASDDSKESSPQDKKQSENDANQGDESPAETNESSDDQNDRYNNTQKDQKDGHADPSQKQEQKPAQSNISVDNTQQQAAAVQDQIPEELAGPDKQWMRCALEACDKQDNTHNKQLLKAVVGMDKGDRRAVRHSW